MLMHHSNPSFFCISYSYDGIGQVVSEKSENGEKRYSYDNVGNLTEKYK